MPRIINVGIDPSDITTPIAKRAVYSGYSPQDLLMMFYSLGNQINTQPRSSSTLSLVTIISVADHPTSFHLPYSLYTRDPIHENGKTYSLVTIPFSEDTVGSHSFISSHLELIRGTFKGKNAPGIDLVIAFFLKVTTRNGEIMSLGQIYPPEVFYEKIH